MRFRSVIPFFVMMIFAGQAVKAQSGLPSQKVGDMELVLLCESQWTGDRSILIGATDEIWNTYAPTGIYFNAVNAFLVRTPDGPVLIDTGYGKKLPANLAEAKVAPAQVGAVMLTHMHGDHIGGLLRGGKAVFPNADIYISREEYNHWSASDNKSAKEVLAVYKERIKLFDPAQLSDHVYKELLPGIAPIAAYGHTPGHTMYLLRSAGRSLLVWGDMAHAMAIQMPHPEVAVRYDDDPVSAVKSRTAVLEYVARRKIPVAGMHVPYPGMGTVDKAQLNKSAGGRFAFFPYSVN